MIIATALQKNYSRENAVKVATYAVASAKNFQELMQCFLSNEYRLAQHAAWCVNWAAKKKTGMIQPHIGSLVKSLTKKGVHNAVIRNSVRILESIQIPAKYHGDVMNACFHFIEDPATPPAIKAFSLTTLFNLSVQYPEIKPELKLIIEDRWDTETPAFRSRGKKILAAIGG